MHSKYSANRKALQQSGCNDLFGTDHSFFGGLKEKQYITR